MEGTPLVERCPNCGAPLELEDGKCRWCNAAVRVQPAAAASGILDPDLDFLSDDGLVPDEVDDQSVAPFIYLTLSTFGYPMNSEPAIRDFVNGQPGMQDQIRALVLAVSAGGVRVRDAGLLKDGFDQNLSLYTPDELWTSTSPST